MPGGQFTNLKEEARSLGLQARWHEVAQTNADVNEMFGDVVKVTPSSKVVGDMALMMVSQDLTVDDVLEPGRDVAFPESVVSLMRGELSQMPGGFPENIQKKVLKDESPLAGRFGELLESVDLEQARSDLSEQLGREVNQQELASSNMYPKVFADFSAIQEMYGPTSHLPTNVYFYGLKSGDEIFVEIEPVSYTHLTLPTKA